MRNSEVIVRKVELESFIDTLVYLYDGGVEFVDLIVKPNSIQDNIGIVVRQEYALPQEEEEFNGPLTEDDINQLITT